MPEAWIYDMCPKGWLHPKEQILEVRGERYLAGDKGMRSRGGEGDTV